ncbi:hypothetical protein [Mycolicibacterium porcinum]|uniref:hypothetical protein n=1 Tax=Mycolicibacterium porcinum TaxID=39693 RepID=UPI001041D616|nr:hypothetical protein [Mycolicibacterium porcinum]
MLRPRGLSVSGTFVGARDFLLIALGDIGYVVNQFRPTGVDYFAEYPAAPRIVWAVDIARA